MERKIETDSEIEKVYDFFHDRGIDEFGPLVRQATDEVIATSRTGRWHLDQCNRQEMAYLGVNIENLIRQAYNLGEPHGRMDFNIDGVEVDCKWSRNFGQWQIPREAVGHICLLVYGDDMDGVMAVGLIRIREEILVGGNRDQKRTIKSPAGVSEIRWLIERDAPLPENFLLSLRKADRDAILAQTSGDDRLVELFQRCEGRIITRHAIESVAQQVDATRRARAAGVRLAPKGMEVLCGYRNEDKARALQLGGPVPRTRAEYVCLRADGTTPERVIELEAKRIKEAAAFRSDYKKMAAAVRSERNRRRKEADAAIRAAAEAIEVIEATDEYAPLGDIVHDAAQNAELSAVRDSAPPDVSR
ncbi:NaeI family type II restriction endonuclease [Dactylosporangium sp. NPDC051485]|uniref:NaeI family type II restriction endonuclease n=1 Tax=Dactylosporangium sp. NPDC051485 TaxID=3154846 RepID=UPI003425AABE